MNGMAADRHGHSERVKELVRQHWNRRAADFDLEASHGLLTDAQAHAWRRLISDLAGAVPLDVLDIGCGTGFLSLLFAAERHRVTGVDMAPTMLARARDKAKAQGLVIRFIEADAETLDLAPASQDLIVGRPEAEMAALVRAHGFASVGVEPLMDPELWTEPPGHPRYIVTARA